MKLTPIIQTYRSMFAIKIVFTVLNFHVQGRVKNYRYIICWARSGFRNIFNRVKLLFSLLYCISVHFVMLMQFIDRITLQKMAYIHFYCIY